MLTASFVFGLAGAALVLHFMAGKDGGYDHAPAALPATANNGQAALEKRDAALLEAQQRKAMADVSSH